MGSDPQRGQGMADFEEEDRLRDGPMEEEILTMVIEALNRQGHPDLSRQSVYSDAGHRRLAIDMLKDCRPLPVILTLIAELESLR